VIDEKSLSVFKEMVESFGPAGFELETSRIVKKYVSTFADEVVTDKLGSLIFKVKGEAERPHILVAGHIDEIGFVVSGIDEKTGFLTFNSVGGWFDQSLLSQRVVVRTKSGDLMGVIASKPPHVLQKEEYEKPVTRDKMFIDIGTTSKEETEKRGVRIGDPVVPWSPFQRIMDGRVLMGKAFDDRIGAFITMYTLKKLKEKNVPHPNTVYGAATVQEELGARGASTVPYVVDPDVAIVVEVDIAGDVPGIKPNEAPAKMGKGPSIVTFDASMIPNQNLKEMVIETAEKNKIPYQLTQSARGGTDAGRIHIHKTGCPSIVISVPTRHIHSHVSLASLEDVENTHRLILELLKTLDKKAVETLLPI